MYGDPAIASPQDDDRPFSGFAEWFADEVDAAQPDIVIVIARGAIRLLQIGNCYPLGRGLPVFSHYALPFLPREVFQGRRVLLFDDSVIFGSTMAAIREHLMRIGANVFCLTYVIDRDHFYGSEGRQPSRHSAISVRSRYLVSSNAVRRHHDAVVAAMLSKPLDYNVEFPSLTVRLSGIQSDEVPGLVNRALAGAGIAERPTEVSPGSAVESGVFRFSTQLSGEWNPLSASDAWLPLSKVRTLVSVHEQLIRVTPVPQFIADRKLLDNPSFLDPIALAAWRTMDHGAAGPAAHGFRLLTCVAATVIAARLASSLRRGLADAAASDVEFDVSDARLIIGDANADGLRHLWASMLPMAVCPVASPETQTNVLDVPQDSDLCEKIPALWRQKPWLMPQPSDMPTDQVTKVLLAVREVTDSDEQRTADPSSGRLDRGLDPASMARLIAMAAGQSPTASVLSFCLDVAVDGGQAVPRVLELDGKVFRAFYSGENINASETQQFKVAIYEAYKKHLQQNHARHLSPYRLHKLCVTLKETVAKWLPMSTGFSTFGKVGTVDHEDLVSWLAPAGGDGPLHRVRTESGDRLDYNRSFRPAVEGVWSDQRAERFYSGFHYLAQAFTHTSSDAVLLLSTCHTHRDTFDAVATEGHRWANDLHKSFRCCVDNWVQTTDGRLRLSSSGLTALCYSWWYLVEAGRKRAVFYDRFEELRKELSGAFLAEGPAAEAFWKYKLGVAEVLNNLRDPHVEIQFRVALPIIQQMRELTALTAHLMVSSGAISRAEILNEFSRLAGRMAPRLTAWLLDADALKCANRYNSNIGHHQIAGDSILRTAIPLASVAGLADGSAPAAFSEIRSVIGRCADELKTAYTIFCPHYDTGSGGSPFTPQSNRRLLSDGTEERDLLGQCILTLDVVKSTDSSAAAALKTRIIQLLDSFREHGLLVQEEAVVYDTSGNDAYVVCGTDSTAVWDVAQAIAVTAEPFIDKASPFGGTRKGLWFGDVTIQTKPDGRTIVKDAEPPHDLPKAFGLLEAYRSPATATMTSSTNLTLIIELYGARKHAAALGLNLTNAKSISVSAKHFRGRAVVVDLLTKCPSLVEEPEPRSGP